MNLLATESQLAYPPPAVNKTLPSPLVDDVCGQYPSICPLSRVTVGAAVRVKRLAAAPDVNRRLREMGVREEQQIKLVSRQTNVICKVCNARLGLSTKLAESILVEPVPVARRPH